MVRRREYHYCVLALFSLLILFLPREAHAGYTHYWKWHVDPDREKVDRALAEMSLIVDARRDIVEVRDFDAGISFNGIGENAHEIFDFPIVHVGAELQFVKTAYKPYDVVVTACLIVARDHFTRDELEILSDGDWALSWRPGAELYTKVLGRPATNPLSENIENIGGGVDARPEPGGEPSPENGRLRAIIVTAAVIVAVGVIRVLTAGRG